MGTNKVVFDFRDVADRIRFLPIVPKYGGPIATFIYTSPEEKIIITLFRNKFIKTAGNGYKTETDLENIQYVDDNCILSDRNYYCWRGQFRTNHYTPVTKNIGYVTVADSEHFRGIGYLNSPPVILFRYDFMRKVVTDLHPAFKSAVKKNSKPTMKERELLEEGAVTVWGYGKYPPFLDQAEDFRDLDRNKIYARMTREVEYPIYPTVGMLATDNPVLKTRQQPEESHPVPIANPSVTPEEEEEVSVLVPMRQQKLPVVSVPPLSIEVINNFGIDMAEWMSKPRDRRVHWATVLGAFEVSYFNSIRYVKNLPNERYTGSRVGVFPYVVTPRGNLYLITRKKRTRWCPRCIGDLGGGVGARQDIYEKLKIEIWEELSADHGEANARLANHIISELEKTNRTISRPPGSAPKSTPYDTYRSNIPFGISLQTVSYFDNAAQKKSARETFTSHYKVIYTQVLVPINGDYINIDELNSNIARDRKNETDHLMLVDEPTFINMFAQGKTLDEDFNAAMQILKKVEFRGISHPCKVTYRELYESVKERALDSRYPYYHKYGENEIIRRLNASDYTRLCYLYQKMTL